LRHLLRLGQQNVHQSLIHGDLDVTLRGLGISYWRHLSDGTRRASVVWELHCLAVLFDRLGLEVGLRIAVDIRVLLTESLWLIISRL